MNLTLTIFLSYLIGAIPTSIIVSKLWKGIDIREYGSKNAGFTNVVRVLGYKPGIIVAIVDIGKGLIATIFISKISINSINLDNTLIQILAGFSAIIGHIWTIFAKFKGGKGVLTALGMIIGLNPISAGICFFIWAIIVYFSKYVSLGSIASSLFFPVIIFVEKYYFNKSISEYLLIFSILICILIIYTHRSNIKRLIYGTENKFERKVNKTD